MNKNGDIIAKENSSNIQPVFQLSHCSDFHLAKHNINGTLHIITINIINLENHIDTKLNSDFQT